jgi:hypothetical protein
MKIIVYVWKDSLLVILKRHRNDAYIFHIAFSDYLHQCDKFLKNDSPNPEDVPEINMAFL